MPAVLKIGLISQSASGPTEIVNLITWAQSRDDMEISHLILCPKDAQPHRLNALTFSALTALESVLKRQSDFADYVPQQDLTVAVPTVLEVHTTSDQGLEQIRATGCDVLIQWDDADIPPQIAACVPFGVLGVHYGTSTSDSDPPGFTEVLQREPTTAFELQHYDAAGRRVLRRGTHATTSSFLTNRASVAQLSQHHLRWALAQLAVHRALPTPLSEQPGPLGTAAVPQLRRQVAYFVRRLRSIISNRWERLRHREPIWSVGFQQANWPELDPARAIEIPNPPGTFLADPFVIEHQGQHYCFVEEFPFATQKGIISVYALEGDTSRRLGVALEEDFHLSFPNVFHYQGEVYMCPETLGAGEIRVYRCVDFPLHWEVAQVLLPEVDACDTLLLPRNDQWWMLTNIDPSGLGKPGSELHAFWSDSPLSDRWQPHPDNPLITDAQAARNGGVLCDDSGIHRVAQRLGFIVYGTGATIRRIDQLDEQGYAEEVVRALEPNFLPGIRGCHHLHTNNHYTVFDFAR